MASKHFLRSQPSPLQTLAASASITPVDLPVNPLSILYLSFMLTQPAQTAADLYTILRGIGTMITNISVQILGQNIINASLNDIMMMNARAFGLMPRMTRSVPTTGAVRTVTFPISFSRRPYWHSEGLPPVTRGNLRFFMTAGALPASLTVLNWWLESVEMLDDKPVRYCKYIVNTKALTATGQFDAPLPIGNPIAGILLFEPSIFGTTADALSWGQVKLLVDNVEQYFPLSDFESLVVASDQLDFERLAAGEHVHQENLAAAYAQFAFTTAAVLQSEPTPEEYGFMDFDPLQDDSYLLDTAGHADVKLRGFADAATPNNTVRWLPLELVTIQ